MSTDGTLLDLQQGVARVLTGEQVPDMALRITAHALGSEARLQIYRNAMLHNLTAALRTAYPAVHGLVGEEFFESAAMRYIHDYPSRSGNLQEYGAAFPQFLAAMPEARGVPYLPDVSRLEWARQECYLAADVPWLTVDAISMDIDSRPTATRLLLHPAVGLVQSAYPILDIWRYCQDPSTEAPSLDDGGQQVLVWREDHQIAMQVLAPGAAAFIGSVLTGNTISQALTETATIQPDAFDFPACLLWLFETRLVTGVSLPNPECDTRSHR